MIVNHIRSLLVTIASDVVYQLIPLEQTQAIVMRDDLKLDRIDTKLIKESEKISNREREEVKHEGTGKRKGSITYRSYTIDFKKKLIASIRQELENSNACLSKIIRGKAKEHGIHPKNINRWYHTKELKKKQGGRKALFPEMEARLARFILSNPEMKRKHILRQAKQIMEDLKIPGRQNFNFSKGWYERFRERLVKRKVPDPLKLEENAQLKNEAKLEDSNNQLGSQEEDLSQYDQDDSFDSEDNVKLEEELSDTEEETCKKFKAPMDKEQEELDQTIERNKALRNSKGKQMSLFFEDDQ